MKSIAVYCGSNSGNRPEYAEAAAALGKLLAKKNIEIIYGAGNVGLMGVLAEAALAAGGVVTGIIPTFLRTKEVCHEGLTNLHVVDSMQERKVKMVDLSQGTIILPGGFGTLDEMFEVLTLLQLGQQAQPLGILNVCHYYDHLIAQVAHMQQEKFLKEVHEKMILSSDKVEDLLALMLQFTPPQTGKWL